MREFRDPVRTAIRQTSDAMDDEGDDASAELNTVPRVDGRVGDQAARRRMLDAPDQAAEGRRASEARDALHEAAFAAVIPFATAAEVIEAALPRERRQRLRRPHAEEGGPLPGGGLLRPGGDRGARVPILPLPPCRNSTFPAPGRSRPTCPSASRSRS
jgi:hypothetical protein